METFYGEPLRACLPGERVPLGDRGTIPTRGEDTAVLHAKFEHSRGTSLMLIAQSRSASKSIESQFDLILFDVS